MIGSGRWNIWAGWIALLCASLFLSGCAAIWPDTTAEDTGAKEAQRVADHPAQPQEPDCLGLHALKPSYTPPDLHASLSRCIAQGKFSRAAQLFIVAGVYARFDGERLADSTAMAGGKILNAETVSRLTDEQRAQLRVAIQKILDEPAELKLVCSALEDTGYPRYFPEYLIQQGAQTAASDATPEDALLPAFDSQAVWEQLLATYALCPQ